MLGNLATLETSDKAVTQFLMCSCWHEGAAEIV